MQFLTNLDTIVEQFLDWLNQNQGVLTLLIFLVTLFLGWISGIFASLRRKPKLTVSLIPGPTFACMFPTGNMHGEYEAHQTGIALYLKISNVGAAPVSVDAVHVGYHWHLRPLSLVWVKYRIGWFWLREQSVALSAFQANIGDYTKVYPFLTQRSHLSGSKADTYLHVGQSTNGVVYFEQSESWGGCFPRNRKGYSKVKVRILDVMGREYVSKHKIPFVSFSEAQKYNPNFGKTLGTLHGENLATPEEIIDPSEKAGQ